MPGGYQDGRKEFELQARGRERVRADHCRFVKGTRRTRARHYTIRIVEPGTERAVTPGMARAAP